MASCVSGKWTQRGSWRAPIWIPPRISVHMLRPWAGHCTHAGLGDDHLDLRVIVWFQRFVEIWGVSPALCTTNYSKKKNKSFLYLLSIFLSIQLILQWMCLGFAHIDFNHFWLFFLLFYQQFKQWSWWICCLTLISLLTWCWPLDTLSFSSPSNPIAYIWYYWCNDETYMILDSNTSNWCHSNSESCCQMCII